MIKNLLAVALVCAVAYYAGLLFTLVTLALVVVAFLSPALVAVAFSGRTHRPEQ